MIPGVLSEIITPPTAAVVTLADCKGDLRIDNDAEDDLVTSYILAAVRMAGEITGRVLAPTGIALHVRSAAPDGCVVVPYTPVTALTAIKYYDPDGNQQTATLTDFRLYAYDGYAIVETVPGKTWPATETRRDALTIEFTAGYDPVPETITRAIRLIVGHWFENRTAVVTGTTATELPMAAETLLGLERVGWSA